MDVKKEKQIIEDANSVLNELIQRISSNSPLSERSDAVLAAKEQIRTQNAYLNEQESKSIVVSKSAILASLAYCAIKQSPYERPANLEAALDAVSKKIDELKLFASDRKQSYDSYNSFTCKELQEIIGAIVHIVPEVAIWNVTKVEQDNGITSPDDPNRSVKMSFVSRFSITDADKDFIDLDALSRNVINFV